MLNPIECTSRIDQEIKDERFIKYTKYYYLFQIN